MWRWYTAEDRRQAAALMLLLAVTGLFVVALAPTFTGLTLGHAVASDGASQTSWINTATRLWRRPGRPDLIFGAGVRPVLYWSLTLPLILVLVGGYSWFAAVAYGWTAPLGSGFASRADLARDLSVGACRARARTTRPDFDRRGRRRVGIHHLGIPLHRSAIDGTYLWLPLENATGVIAPQQSGKTLMDLLHKVVSAPGGLIVTSTKLDLFLLTARARERSGSTVRVLDLTGAVRWPARVRWNPIRGCETVRAAKRRAQALLRATAGDGLDGNAEITSSSSAGP